MKVRKKFVELLQASYFAGRALCSFQNNGVNMWLIFAEAPWNLNHNNCLFKITVFTNTMEIFSRIYNVRCHPKYQNGEWTEKQCFEEFLKSFEPDEARRDGQVWRCDLIFIEFAYQCCQMILHFRLQIC